MDNLCSWKKIKKLSFCQRNPHRSHFWIVFSKKFKSKVFKDSNEFLSILLNYRNPSFRPNGLSPSHPPLPQLRIAEKKRIKRINEDDDGEDPPQQVTGSDLSSVGVRFYFNLKLLNVSLSKLRVGTFWPPLSPFVSTHIFWMTPYQKSLSYSRG